MSTFHLDYETFSKADLKKVGAFRYANDPSTEILCMALARDDEAPIVWRCDGMWSSPQELARFQEYLEELCDPASVIYAHNAQFEIAITDALFSRTFKSAAPEHNQWRCTAGMAKRAALPRSLEKIGEALKLTDQKDKKGSSLIRLFSIMQKPRKVKGVADGEEFRVLPQHQPEKFQQFVDYCRQDVIVEREVHKKLHNFEIKGFPLQTFQLDIAINTRGFPVNLRALHNAQKIIDEVVAQSSAEFREITGFEVTQRDRLLTWLKARGYKGDKLTATHVDEALDEDDEDISDEGLTDEARRALTLRKNTSYAAVKKVSSMLACAGPHDNRIRGCLDWHGPTTGRWAGKLVQPQNFKRPTIKTTDEAYADICAGCNATWLRLNYGEPLEVISSCIRHFIHDYTEVSAPDRFDTSHRMETAVIEREMFDADYAAIEARIVCWIADEEEAIQEYRDGIDRYVRMASLIYGAPDSTITKDQRFVGKQVVLGCGFGLGPGKFQKMCEQFGNPVEAELAERAVTAFRNRHKKLVRLWYAAEASCKQAVNMPNTKFKIGSKCEVFCSETAGMMFMMIRLPSGRLLAYPQPRIESDGRLTFYGQIPGTQKWAHIDTYGGKLIENIVQGIAADVMGNGAVNAERAGYQIATLIHDQALGYKQQGQTIERFVELLTALPAWANGLPIVAEGNVVKYYTK